MTSIFRSFVRNLHVKMLNARKPEKKKQIPANWPANYMKLFNLFMDDSIIPVEQFHNEMAREKKERETKMSCQIKYEAH